MKTLTLRKQNLNEKLVDALKKTINNVRYSVYYIGYLLYAAPLPDSICFHFKFRILLLDKIFFLHPAISTCLHVPNVIVIQCLFIYIWHIFLYNNTADS